MASLTSARSLSARTVLTPVSRFMEAIAAVLRHRESIRWIVLPDLSKPTVVVVSAILHTHLHEGIPPAPPVRLEHLAAAVGSHHRSESHTIVVVYLKLSEAVVVLEQCSLTRVYVDPVQIVVLRDCGRSARQLSRRDDQN